TPSRLPTPPSRPLPTPSPYTTLFRSLVHMASPEGLPLTLLALEDGAQMRDVVGPVFAPAHAGQFQALTHDGLASALDPATADVRSEEHTSELQSPCNLVCRLLLEKKK